MKEQPYSPKFVKRILKAKENVKKGKYITIRDTKNIWADILDTPAEPNQKGIIYGE